VNQTDLDRQDLTSQVLLLKGLDQTDQSHLLDHVDHDQAVQAQRSQDLDRRALLVTDPDPDLGVLQVTNLDPSRDHALDQEVLLPTDQNLLNQTDLRVQVQIDHIIHHPGNFLLFINIINKRVRNLHNEAKPSCVIRIAQVGQ
jgi:hypothetical protein